MHSWESFLSVSPLHQRGLSPEPGTADRRRERKGSEGQSRRTAQEGRGDQGGLPVGGSLTPGLAGPAKAKPGGGEEGRHGDSGCRFALEPVLGGKEP